MSQENVEIVERAVAAVNARDVEGYVAYCTPDFELRGPLAAIAGVYKGPDGIRQFFADLDDAFPDFRLELERVVAIGSDRVLAFLVASASGRASGLSGSTPRWNVYDLVDGKIRRLRIFEDRQEAFEAVGLSEQDAHADS
jgi:ketosteroid isomerase-like protein